MSVTKSEKAKAWDLVGGLFWRVGRQSAKPSEREIDLYLAALQPGQRCCILGASTKDLVAAALERGFETTVLDFSEVMLRDLQEDLGAEGWTGHHHDVLQPVSESLRETQDLVVTDRLVNRFSREECPAFFANVLGLLRDGGRMRQGIKLGFYPMDLKVIEEGRRRGTLDQFFDEETSTLDFARARSELDVALVPHGNIPREILLQWYDGRGRESRFSRADIEGFVRGISVDGRSFAIEELDDFPDAPETIMVSARAIRS